jgi:hypothetical protein
VYDRLLGISSRTSGLDAFGSLSRSCRLLRAAVLLMQVNISIVTRHPHKMHNISSIPKVGPDLGLPTFDSQSMTAQVLIVRSLYLWLPNF